MKHIILAFGLGILTGIALAGVYTNYERYSLYENDSVMYLIIVNLHWLILGLSFFLAKPFLSMERTEQILPVIVMFLTLYLTMGIWIFS